MILNEEDSKTLVPEKVVLRFALNFFKSILKVDCDLFKDGSRHKIFYVIIKTRKPITEPRNIIKAAWACGVGKMILPDTFFTHS